MKILGIILAGGFGIRLRKYLPFSLPKCLLPCKGKPLIVNVVEKIRNLCDVVYVLVNKVHVNLYEQFMKLFNVVDDCVKIIAEPTECEERKLGSVGAIYWFVKNFADVVKDFDYVLVTPCDIYFENGSELLKMLDIVVKFNQPVIAITYIHPQYVTHFGVVELTYDVSLGVEKVVSFIEKPVKTYVGTVFTGIAVFPRELLVKEVINYVENYKGDRDKLGNFIKYLVDEGKYTVLTHLLKIWIDVGVPELLDEYVKMCIS